VPPYNPLKEGISATRLMGFLKCRKFASLTQEGWRPIRQASVLQFGEMAHGVLEHLYSSDRKRPPEKSEVFKLIQQRADAWEKSPAGLRASADDAEQLEFNITLLEAVLPGYFKFWGAEDFGRVNWVELEQEFLTWFEGFPLRGKIDGVYRDGTKKLWVLETKTKGRIEEETMDDLLAFDFQSDLYCLAAEDVYKEPVKGVRYNIIRRPGEKIGKGDKRKSLAQLRDFITQKVEKDPAHYFVRYRIERVKKDMETFKAELRPKLKEYKDWLEGRLPTYRNETACMDRYGSCRFLKICASNNFAGFYRPKHFIEGKKEA
jgi:hypothetical protein